MTQHALAEAFRTHGNVIGAIASDMFKSASQKRSVEMNVQLTPPLFTPSHMVEWTNERAQKGDRLTYHYGLLMADRDLRRPFGSAVNEIACTAWDLYEAGKVKLIQRRSGDGLYHYMMERN